MVHSRALLALGTAAALVLTVLALPNRSNAQSTDSALAPSSQSWTKIDANGEYISQDGNYVFIYAPYVGRLTMVNKSSQTVMIVDTRKVDKPKAGDTGPR